MTWKTPEAVRLNRITLVNGSLRHYGMPQKPPDNLPAWDATKVKMHHVLQAALVPFRRSETLRGIIRGMIYGKNATYYL